MGSSDLIIRKRTASYRGEIHGDKLYELQLRYHGPVETEYTHVAYITKDAALEIIDSTDEKAYFLFPHEHPYYPHKMETHEDGTQYPEPTRGFKGWIGVDWDGTFAHYDEWQGPHKSGKPIEKMVERMKTWIAEGKTVKIITARVGNQNRAYAAYCTKIIQDVLESVGLPRLEVTATKDFAMIEMWDDRCIPVVPNTGMTWTEYAAQERTKTVHHEAD